MISLAPHTTNNKEIPISLNVRPEIVCNFDYYYIIVIFFFIRLDKVQMSNVSPFVFFVPIYSFSVHINQRSLLFCSGNILPKKWSYIFGTFLFIFSHNDPCMRIAFQIIVLIRYNCIWPSIATVVSYSLNSIHFLSNLEIWTDLNWTSVQHINSVCWHSPYRHK